MISLSSILSERLKAANQNPESLNDFYKRQSTEDTKKRNFAIKCFQERVNKDRKSCGLTPLPFMAIYGKLVALKEIHDLKWFWIVCTKYSKTYKKERDLKGKPIRNSFAQCFFGALDCKKDAGV